MWFICHPHVFPSVEYWLASKRGKKAKETQHTQKNERYNLHKKHDVLDSSHVMKTLEFFLVSALSLEGCESCHYVWFAAACKFPPHQGHEETNCRSREGGCCQWRDCLSSSHGLCQPQGYQLPCCCDTWPPGFILEVTKNIWLQVTFRILDSFFAWRP